MYSNQQTKNLSLATNDLHISANLVEMPIGVF